MAYKVPFVNYQKYFKLHGDEMMDTLRRVLSRGDLLLRDDVDKLEHDVPAYLGLKYGVGLNSGTDSLHLSLLAAGIKPGDEVITSVIGFSTDFAPLVRAGLVPAFVDVEPDPYNLDVDGIENADDADSDSSGDALRGAAGAVQGAPNFVGLSSDDACWGTDADPSRARGAARAGGHRRRRQATRSSWA